MWDLDPGPEVAWKDVVAGAKGRARRVDGAEARVLGKDDGRARPPVVMPIKPTRDGSDLLKFSRAVLRGIERSDPQHYTTTFAKAGPERKILIDYLRNIEPTGQSALSHRGPTGATVSMPLSVAGVRRCARAVDALTSGARTTRHAFARCPIEEAWINTFVRVHLSNGSSISLRDRLLLVRDAALVRRLAGEHGGHISVPAPAFVTLEAPSAGPSRESGG